MHLQSCEITKFLCLRMKKFVLILLAMLFCVIYCVNSSEKKIIKINIHKCLYVCKNICVYININNN